VTAKTDSQVANLQQSLKTMGFNPNAVIDGIYGYRTLSSVRLFQEYVRTIEGDSGIGTADGIAGKNTLKRIDEWVANGKAANWTPADDMQPKIFAGLNQIRDRLKQSPDAAIEALNKAASTSCSLKVADWRYDPDDIHLVGIRRDNTSVILRNGKYVRRNDDIFVLLVNGFRIVFRGSTDPSPSMAGRKDAAFLIRGQHEYRFGWHKISTVGSDTVKVYRAFKTKSNKGVLVVRATDGQLTPASYAKGAQPNPTINIHWSGSGSSNWSAGCQVIAGKKYKNFLNEIIDLSASASAGYAGLGSRTRGAYNMLIDLVTVFSKDIRCGSSDTLYCTLLYEKDLASVPDSAGIDFKGLVEELS
jgi:peptidoglycan hydrolase-like protein with peptidoglycan-binding domain